LSTRTPAALALCLLLATAASAQVSDKYKAWREGPVQWIMTGDEQKAWRGLKNDDEAKAFVDLFWARRDPTPSTFENEFRAEHEGRVLVADRDWSEKEKGKEKRGALTDRGRVYIVLGNPSRMAKIAQQTTGSGNGDASTLGGTGRLMAGREEWFYNRDVTKKWGVPEATVVFLAHPQTGRVTRDVQRTDFVGASSGAIKSYVVDKNMKTVPEWAAVGGLNPITFRLVPAAAAPATPVTPGSDPAVPAQPAAPASGSTASLPIPVPESFEPKGASRLTLSHDVYEVDSEAKTDPFLKLKSVDAFKASEELGWASQICTGSNDEPTVRYQLRLTGTAAGEEIDRAAEPDELVPDRISALNGCYMMRGAVPLEGMSPGNYQLEVAIYDPETRRDTVLRKAFRIE
jgi:GWxTD domain-containing protein